MKICRMFVMWRIFIMCGFISMLDCGLWIEYDVVAFAFALHFCFVFCILFIFLSFFFDRYVHVYVVLCQKFSKVPTWHGALFGETRQKKDSVFIHDALHHPKLLLLLLFNYFKPPSHPSISIHKQWFFIFFQRIHQSFMLHC